MADDHIKAVLEGIKETLEDSNDLDNTLTKVLPYFAVNARDYYIKDRMVTIQLLIGDSAIEEPLHNEPEGTDFMSTDFLLVCDTALPSDREMYLPENGDGLLDLEFKVIRGLLSTEWLNAATHHYGWSIGSIERNIPVLDENGEEDFDVRRFIITIVVDVKLDRDEDGGPAR
jgi:hypothetical protein